MTAESTLKTTPLNESHRALGAKMVEFGGWEMPLQYPDGIQAEYKAVREGVGIFDTSHMGEFFITCSANGGFLDRCVTQNLARADVKTCHYGFLLNDQGGVMDDLIVYRLGEDAWMVVVNAGTTAKDAARFQDQCRSHERFEDRSEATGKIDIQGPKSREWMAALFPGSERLEYYTFDHFNWEGKSLLISRTGYTGELGYEIYCPSEDLPKLWDLCIAKGAVPAGLAVRDILRIEMGYCLYGHELSDTINPLEAGGGRFIDWEKDFLGKSALLAFKEKGLTRRLRCLISASRRSPRQGHAVTDGEGHWRGEVTSGTFSFHAQRGVGLGFVDPEMKVGDKIKFGEKGKWIDGEISSRPIYRQGSVRA